MNKIRAQFLVNTVDGSQLATLTLDLQDIAQGLARRANASKSKKAFAMFGAITLHLAPGPAMKPTQLHFVAEPVMGLPHEPILTDEERAALKEASK